MVTSKIVKIMKVTYIYIIYRYRITLYVSMFYRATRGSEFMVSVRCNWIKIDMLFIMSER
jgi:hypothetical protein